MFQTFSDRQVEAIVGQTAFINALDGPVRAGKTVAQRFAVEGFLPNCPHENFLVTGKTKDTIRRNILDDLLDLFDLVGHSWTWNRADGEVRVRVPGPRVIRLHIVGANDEAAESRVRGLTIGGWLADEVTLYPQSFVQMAVSRMSPPGSRAFWTMNADSPHHYILREYLENEELIRQGIMNRIRFKLYDNWSLSKRYVQNLKTLYTGLWYRRFIEGEWAIAEGAVYDLWDPKVHVIKGDLPKFSEVIIGVDYGTSNPFAAIALGKIAGTRRGWVAFAELRHEGRNADKQATTGKHSEMLREWLVENKVRNPVIMVDPSAAAFKVQLREDGLTRVHDADNAVRAGIMTVGTALEDGGLRIHESCRKLIEEFPGYVWDPKKQAKGEDVPLKENGEDHSLDALRYGARRAFGRPALTVIENHPIAGVR